MPFGNRFADRSPLGTNAQAIRCILHIATGERLSVRGQQSRTNQEIGIRSIGELPSFGSLLNKVLKVTRQIGCG